MYINTVDEVDILLSLDSCFSEVIGVLWDIKTKKQIQKTSPMKIQMFENSTGKAKGDETEWWNNL